MNKYLISMTVDEDGLMRLVHAGAIMGATIAPTSSDTVETVRQLHPAPKARLPRSARPSKVNVAIIDALADGPQNTSKLKEALVKANLAAGSLSTGVAQLLKSGQIERGDGGMYSLPVRKAAE